MQNISTEDNRNLTNKEYVDELKSKILKWCKVCEHYIVNLIIILISLFVENIVKFVVYVSNYMIIIAFLLWVALVKIIILILLFI